MAGVDGGSWIILTKEFHLVVISDDWIWNNVKIQLSSCPPWLLQSNVTIAKMAGSDGAEQASPSPQPLCKASLASPWHSNLRAFELLTWHPDSPRVCSRREDGSYGPNDLITEVTQLHFYHILMAKIKSKSQLMLKGIRERWHLLMGKYQRICKYL